MSEHDGVSESGGRPEPGGKREQHKRSTRRALQAAADRLFAEQGYEQTTVKQIAAAAGVTERTFFRYFAVKEELAVGQAMSWIPGFVAAVRERPHSESAIVALKHAVLAAERAMRTSRKPTLLSLYANHPPIALIRRYGARHIAGRVTEIELALAPALTERLRIDGYPDDRMLAVRGTALARAAVGALRTAFVEDLTARRSGAPDRPSLAQLIELVLDDLEHGWRPH